MPPLFSQFSDINPSKLTWAVKARLIRVYDVPVYGNSSKKYSLECIFHDSEGTKVHATVKQNLIQKYQALLKETQLYLLKNFIVAENRMKYKTTTAKYKIIFVGTTRLSEMKDAAFPHFVFAFKPFEELSNAESIDESLLIDVIGKLHAKAFPQRREIRGRDTKMIDLILENSQGTTLPCTFWGQPVDDLCDYLSTVSSDEPIIILLQFCRVNVFRGELRVSNTYHVSKVIINANMAEINQLRKSFISEGRMMTPVGKISSITTGNVIDEFENSKDLLRTIEQILETEDVGSYWVIGKIAAVETGEDWWYISCKKCPKKMIPAAEKFYCDNCDCFDTAGNIRYKLQVRVIDFSGNASFLLWDKECNELIGKTALELRNKSENDYPTEIISVIEKNVLFKIQVKDDNGSVYAKVFPVIKIIQDNSVIDKYRDIHQEGQESDIFSKLKDSDLGDEFDLGSSEDEVSTPNQSKVNLKSMDIAEDGVVKRSLIDDFSSATKEKGVKVVVKTEKE